MKTHSYKLVNYTRFKAFNKLRNKNYKPVSITVAPVNSIDRLYEKEKSVALVAPNANRLLIDEYGINAGDDINSIEISWQDTEGPLKMLEFSSNIGATIANFKFVKEDIEYEVNVLLTDLDGHTLLQQMSAKVFSVSGKDSSLFAYAIAANLLPNSENVKITTPNASGFSGYKPEYKAIYYNKGAYKEFSITNGSQDKFNIVYKRIEFVNVEEYTVVKFIGVTSGQFLNMYFNML